VARSLGVLAASSALVTVVSATPAFAVSTVGCYASPDSNCVTEFFNPASNSLEITVWNRCMWHKTSWIVVDPDTGATVSRGTTTAGDGYDKVNGLYGRYYGYIWSEGCTGHIELKG
jgi:hypothetical protein